MNRRDFLAAAVATGVAAAHSLAAEPLPIIDTHQHLWDLKKFRLPWIKPDNTLLARDYLTTDYLKATAGLNVVKAVYMEVDVAPEQQTAEAAYITGLCKRADTPTVAAVISGRPASDNFGKYLDQFRHNHYVKGVRQVLHGEGTPAGFCLDRAFVRGIRLLGERGLSFDLCMRAGELADAAKLVGECPGTRFILDHCGNPDVRMKDLSAWKKGIAVVAKHPHVMCKVSGFVGGAEPEKWTAEDLAPVVNHVYEAFGPERVMFGGDWPVCLRAATFKQWVEALAAITASRPEAQRRRLFHDNALAFYGLGE
jgi:predicted TIM-barrel fold metal-dependent hydrolase